MNQPSGGAVLDGVALPEWRAAFRQSILHRSISGEIPRRRSVLVTVAELLPRLAVKADLPKSWAYG
ncbi:MAG: hypothetical protein KGS45_13915 [Planctomycetes bacterium]|nr:hypothetical protein [Planctomycetota bacterium]